MRSTSRLSSTLAYAGMILAAVAIFLIIRDYGETLHAPGPTAPVTTTGSPVDAAGSNALSHVLLALAAVVVVGRLLGRAFVAIGQPPVIGEVLGGILLGPSLLGHMAPDVAAYILPGSVAPFLSVVAQLGVILYMFLVGLDLNLDPLRHRARAAVATSHASIVAPFVLGSLLAVYLYPRISTDAVPFTSFALFMGVAMSITAFPVLARILTDRGMSRSELGVIALTCAAADDVTAWCLLAFVVGVVQSQVGSALLVAVYTLGFIAIMFFAVRPAVAGLVRRRGGGASPGQGTVALVLVGLLLSALATERIGVHAVFGAFLFGAIVPRESGLPGVLTGRLEDLVTILLLPAFFGGVGDVSPHHRGGDGGEVRRHARGGAPDGHELAQRGRPRDPHEHARPDGADRAQHRARPRRHLAYALHDDGHHGPRDHDCDDAAPRVGGRWYAGFASQPRPGSRASPMTDYRPAVFAAVFADSSRPRCRARSGAGSRSCRWTSGSSMATAGQ